MQSNSIDFSGIDFIVGSKKIFSELTHIKVNNVFNETIIDFLNELSKIILKQNASKKYPDVITFAFWIRKSSINGYKQQYECKFNNEINVGRGVAFHIAPSNIAVNYAYSLVVGLLTGNINIVRIPSKHFEQVDIINDAIKEALKKCPEMSKYIILIRYGHDKQINDYLSGISDVRIIWGGDQTVKSIRESQINPRTIDVVFADRYSIAIIDSDYYLQKTNKKDIIDGFYNDTFLTDQNACSSPRIVIWLGKRIPEAKQDFWLQIHKKVLEKYNYQPIQGVDKLVHLCTSSCMIDDIKLEKMDDNVITRVLIKKFSKELLNCLGNSGFFYEYDAASIADAVPFCDDCKCQTITFLGKKEDIIELTNNRCKGVDRIVGIGKSMDFDLLWDGYDLIFYLSRVITIKL